VTEYNGTVFRGVSCSDAGRAAGPMPVVPGPPEAPAPLREVEIPIPRELPWIYDGCTEIRFPIHTSRAFAVHQAELPDVILQGTCTLALAAREIVNGEGDGKPELLKELACRFSRFVIPGSSIRLQILAATPSENALAVHFRVLNADGEVALSHGFARLAPR
jgi:acyl dehydratase